MYECATPDQIADGTAWYPLALQQALTFSLRHNIPVRNCAAVIALLSPQHTWSQNLRLAEVCLGGGTPRCIGHLARAAVDARNYGPDVERMGPKVRAFYRAIMGDPYSVVVDRWMLRAMGVDRDKLTLKQYELCASAVRAAAVSVPELPAYFQAIVWCVARGKSF